jgi:hypothetical protein
LERDRLAALQVRAAAMGAIDYSQADPKDINWRIRHRLIIKEIGRQEDLKLYDALHRQWLAYVSHGNLLDESYAEVKKLADKSLLDIQRSIYPWIPVTPPETETKEQKDTIDPETRALIEKYERQRAEASPAP